MKKTAMMLLAALLLAACEKPLVEETAERGNLILQVMQLEQTPFNVESRAAVADRCNRLNFAIYDSEGTRVKQINQQTGDEDFGTASFQLEEGQYRLLVVGHSSSGNPTMTNASKVQFTNATGYTDTFMYSTVIDVSNESLTLPLTLKRIVARCSFVINDAIPETVSQMQFQYTGGSGAFDAATGLGCVNSTQLLKADVTAGQTNTQYDLYTFLHSTDGTLKIAATALDGQGNALYSKEIDVPMTISKVTWCKGDFFVGDEPKPKDISATVTVDDQWEGEIQTTY